MGCRGAQRDRGSAQPNRRSAQPNERVRALLIAEAANPDWVSVPLVGWNQARALLEVTDGHLVTQVRNRDAIAARGLAEGQDFTAIDSERIAAPVYSFWNRVTGGSGKAWTALTAIASIAYYHFEHLLWRRFRKVLEAGEYDVVHRITPLSPTTPSLLASRCRSIGVPFLLGPLNGGVPWPKGFDHLRRQEHEWLSYIRDAYRLLPACRSTRTQASAVIVGSQDTLRLEGNYVKGKSFYLPENGIDPEAFPPAPARASGEGPIRIVFVGRLVPYKGVDMLLEAASPFVRSGRVKIEIVGDGPEMAKLRQLVAADGMEEGVDFVGWVTHDEVVERLGAADVLGFPSIREFGGGVVLEAMAMGAVPVVVDYAGPRELVTPGTGFKIPMGLREMIVREFRSTLDTIVEDPGVLEAKRELGLRHARESFSWKRKAERIVEIYRWCMGAGPKPDFPIPVPDPS